MLGECLNRVREVSPLIHNITNYVTVNDVANIILACGASPIMSDEPMEVEEITSHCPGLNINIGTLNRSSIEAMFAAGKKARELGHVIVIDPVGAGASELRTRTARELISVLHPTAIRGNISEIKAIFGVAGASRGVDAVGTDAITEENLPVMTEFVRVLAGETDCILAVTGAIDLVADKRSCYIIRNGHPGMRKVTGTGCQLSGMLAAFLAANPNCPLRAAAAAVCTMGYAGELARINMQKGEGSAAYRSRIIDAVSLMNGNELERGARYELQ